MRLYLQELLGPPAAESAVFFSGKLAHEAAAARPQQLCEPERFKARSALHLGASRSVSDLSLNCLPGMNGRSSDGPCALLPWRLPPSAQEVQLAAQEMSSLLAFWIHHRSQLAGWATSAEAQRKQRAGAMPEGESVAMDGIFSNEVRFREYQDPLRWAVTGPRCHIIFVSCQNFIELLPEHCVCGAPHRTTGWRPWRVGRPWGRCFRSSSRRSARASQRPATRRCVLLIAPNQLCPAPCSSYGFYACDKHSDACPPPAKAAHGSEG